MEQVACATCGVALAKRILLGPPRRAHAPPR